MRPSPLLCSPDSSFVVQYTRSTCVCMCTYTCPCVIENYIVYREGSRDRKILEKSGFENSQGNVWVRVVGVGDVTGLYIEIW